MKKTKIIYWITTGLLAALMLFSGIQNAMVTQPSIDLITTHLGYPVYFIAYIGVAKILGAIAILIPGSTRIKEWAYAGFTFDLVSAMYSSISVGDPISGWSILFIGLALIAVSYLYYHKLRAYAPTGKVKLA